MLKSSENSGIKLQFDERLRIFYGLIAGGQFDDAWRIAADIQGQLEPADQVVMAALALRRELQKFLG